MLNSKKGPGYKRKTIGTPEALFRLVREILHNGKRIALINDFDATVSQNGLSQGEDPFDTVLDPQAALALAAMGRSGVLIGAISNRSAAQVVVRYSRAGVGLDAVIGSYGMELLSQGRSIIDERFHPFKQEITQILEAVRQSLLTVIGQPNLKVAGMAEVTIPTAWGPLYLENKAVGEGFPEGLAQVYNFNSIAPAGRAEIAQPLQAAFQQQLEVLRVINPPQVEALKRIWDISTSGQPELNGRFSLGLEPSSQIAKGFGLVHLLKSIKEPKPIGLIIYAGDANADAGAMKACKRREIIKRGEVKSVGIWVNPGNNQAVVARESDLSVSGVSRYADLLTDLSKIIIST